MLEDKLKKEIIDNLNNLNKTNLLEVESQTNKLFSILKMKYGINSNVEFKNSSIESDVKLEKDPKDIYINHFDNFNINDDNNYCRHYYNLSINEIVEYAKRNIFVFLSKRIGGVLKVHAGKEGEIFIPEIVIRKLQLTNGSLVEIVKVREVLNSQGFIKSSDLKVHEYKDITPFNKDYNFTGCIVKRYYDKTSKQKYLIIEENIVGHKIKDVFGIEFLMISDKDIEKFKIKDGDIVDISWSSFATTASVNIAWKYKRLNFSIEQNKNLYRLEFSKLPNRDVLIKNLISPRYNLYPVSNLTIESTVISPTNTDEVSKEIKKQKLTENRKFIIKEAPKNTNSVKKIEPVNKTDFIPQTLKGYKICLIGASSRAVKVLENRGAIVTSYDGSSNSSRKENEMFHKSDLLVFVVNNISHAIYYRLKNKAQIEGVKVLHYNGTNENILLESVYESLDINSTI